MIMDSLVIVDLVLVNLACSAAVMIKHSARDLVISRNTLELMIIQTPMEELKNNLESSINHRTLTPSMTYGAMTITQNTINSITTIKMTKISMNLCQSFTNKLERVQAAKSTMASKIFLTS